MNKTEFFRHTVLAAAFIITCLLAAMASWLFLSGFMHYFVMTVAVISALGIYILNPWCAERPVRGYYWFFGVVNTVLGLIPAIILFAWWGFGFMIFGLVLYMVSSAIASGR